MSAAGAFVAPADDEPEIVLRRSRPGWFRLEAPIRYQDPELGTITVPADTTSFETDLASVPWLSAWYIPTLGRHVPAAVLHDALVCDPDDRTYATRDGLTVSGDQADRVFLDAMANLGTPLLRRLVMWSAVSIRTAGGGPRGLRYAAWYLLVLVASVWLSVSVLSGPLTAGPSWYTADRLVGDGCFVLSWLRAGVALFIFMAAIGPLLLGTRRVGATTIQAALYGLTFLPTLLMLPAALVLLGPRAALSTRWPD